MSECNIEPSEIESLEKLIKLAESHRLRALKVGSIEIHLPIAEPEPLPQDVNAMRDAFEGPASEDEVMFWSAGGSGFTDNRGKPIAPPLVGEHDGD